MRYSTRIMILGSKGKRSRSQGHKVQKRDRLLDSDHRIVCHLQTDDTEQCECRKQT